MGIGSLPDGFTVLDVETTFQRGEKRDDPTPFNPRNRLVSVGFRAWDKGKVHEDYLCFYHKEKVSTTADYNILQRVLDSTMVLIGHNIKFDLEWLLECGFQYHGLVRDTMVVEYVLARGQKIPLDLDSTLARYRLEGKDKTVQDYLRQGIGFDEMPWEVVEKYGLRDIRGTEELLLKQCERLKCKPEELMCWTV